MGNIKNFSKRTFIKHIHIVLRNPTNDIQLNFSKRIFINHIHNILSTYTNKFNKHIKGHLTFTIEGIKS